MTLKGSRTAGFTLIEVLVVIFIISIVTTVTLLSIGRNENRDIEQLANELTQLVSLAEEQAMLEPNVLGISLSKNKLKFTSLGKDQETHKTLWLPLNDQVLRVRTIPDNIEVTLQMSGNQVKLDESKEDAPQIIFSTNGDVTPFVMYVGKRGQKPRFVVTADADGNVTSAAIS